MRIILLVVLCCLTLTTAVIRFPPSPSSSSSSSSTGLSTEYMSSSTAPASSSSSSGMSGNTGSTSSFTTSSTGLSSVDAFSSTAPESSSSSLSSSSGTSDIAESASSSTAQSSPSLSNTSGCNCNQSFPSGLVKLRVIDYPGTLNDPNSYVDVIVTSGSVSAVFPAWCSDVSRDIYLNSDYAAVIISSFDPEVSTRLASLGVQLQLGNLTRANYLLSQYLNFQYAASVTYGDLQTAIWNLLQQPGSVDNDPTAPYVSSHVDQLLKDAMVNGTCYRPTLFQDSYVAFIVPVGTWPYTGSPSQMHISNQLLLLQVTIEEQAPCFMMYSNGSSVSCLPASSATACLPISLPSSSSTGSFSSSSTGRASMTSSSTGISSSSTAALVSSTGESADYPNTCNCQDSLQPTTAELTVTKYPGTDIASSYIDITLAQTAPEICPYGKTCEFSAWCSDTSRVIYLDVNYAANLVSSYDSNLTSIFESYGVQINVANITIANYMLNKWWQNSFPVSWEISWGDIQTALWRLLQIPGSVDSDSTAPFNETHVESLLTEAMNHGKCYYPIHSNDLLTVFIVPVGIWETFQPKITNQLLLLQVTLEQFPLPCFQSRNSSNLCWPSHLLNSTQCQSSRTFSSSSSSSSSSSTASTITSSSSSSSTASSSFSSSSSSSTGTNQQSSVPKCCNCSAINSQAADSSSSSPNSTDPNGGISQDEWIGAFIGFILGSVVTLLTQLGMWHVKKRRYNTNDSQRATKHVISQNPHRRSNRARV